MEEPVRDDAAHLKKLREAAGLDVAGLAALSNLSSAQIRQLEDGGDSLFYSAQIKQQALRRVIRLLESPGQTEASDTNSADRVLHTGPNVIDNIIRLSEKNLNNNFVTSAVRRPGASQAKLLMYAVIVLCFAGLLTWQFKRHESQAIYSEWVEPVTATVLPQVQQTAPQTGQTTGAIATEQVPLTTPVAQVVEQVVPAVPVATPTLPDKPAVPPPTPANPTPQATPEDCQKMTSEPKAIATSIHNKPGTYVHLFSNKSIQVCVDDGKNTRTLVNLAPGVGRTVQGVAPWTLSSTELKSLQIYFQGGKVLLPPDAGPRIYLKEQTVSP